MTQKSPQGTAQAPAPVAGAISTGNSASLAASHDTDSFAPDTLQRRASDPLRSVWVRASAGSGKTKVLADRVVRLLLDGVAPEKILCLTFTRAAAAEMSLRVTRQLARWATCDIDLLRRELDVLQSPLPPTSAQLEEARRLFAKVLGCPGGMRIRTIHAFAQEILRRFPLEAGLSPQFETIEEGEAQALWREVRDNLLEKIAETPQSDLTDSLQILVNTLGEYRFSKVLREIDKDPARLRRLCEKGISALAREIWSHLDLEENACESQILLSAVRDEVFAKDDILKMARSLAETGGVKEQKLAQKILDWLALAPEQRVKDFESYKNIFFTQEDKPRKILNAKTETQNPHYAEILAKESTRLDLVRERLSSLKTATETVAVLKIGAALAEAYQDRKNGMGVLDYGDLIQKTIDLFEKDSIAPWVLFKLDGGIDHILVDESQDTNPAQWRIITSLAEEFFSGLSARTEINRTLFVVGDEKQSIYSFMGSDPHAFLKMQDFFRAKINQAEKAYDEVPINISFRSAPAILQAVDAVFAQETARQGVSPDRVTHRPFRKNVAGRVEIWPLIQSEKDEKETPSGAWLLPTKIETVFNPVEELAARISEKIREWLGNGETVFDAKTGTRRAMRPDDIMILVRKRASIVDALVRRLKDLQIPVTGVDRMILMDQLAVMDLVALLNFALLPEDDLNLATVLRGPLLNASEDDLMLLTIGRKDSLWSSLRARKEDHFQNFSTYLAGLLKQADQSTPFAFLSAILRSPCPAAPRGGRYAIWSRLGPESQDAIDELLGCAEKFVENNPPSLQIFSHWLSTSEIELKREMEHGGGQVRITTVHAAKGLESPVVILPDTVSVPRKLGLDRILWHEDRLPFYLPKEPRHAFLRQLRDQAFTKQLEEHRRLLYVALTRPAERLCVCGWTPSRLENFEESWYQLIAKGLADHATVHDNVMILADDMTQEKIKEKVQENISQAAPEKTNEENLHSLPDWAFAPAPMEPTPPKPLAPSRQDEDTDALAPSPREAAKFVRGLLIHRLLQSLPDLAPEDQEKSCRKYLENPQHGLAEKDIAEILQETLRLYRDPSFAPFFAAGSRAEVPIAGVVGTRVIAGQVDRLCFHGDEVWILDYKTNRPPPKDAAQIPALYRKQMESYRAVLAQIFPDKKLRSFLLWTYIPLLMELKDNE